MRDVTIYGIGLRSYGFESEAVPYVTVTQWLSIFFIPLVPIRRAKCRYQGRTEAHQHGGYDFRFEVVEPLPLSLFTILLTYLWTLVSIGIAVGPLTVMFLVLANRPARPLEFCILMLSLLWAVGFVFLVDYRQQRLLEATWAERRRDGQSKQRAIARQSRRLSWSHSHFLPEWVFLGAMIMGIVPGVILAVWLGWGLHAMQLMAMVTSLASLGLVAGLDWLVARKRNHSRQGSGSVCAPGGEILAKAGEKRAGFVKDDETLVVERP